MVQLSVLLVVVDTQATCYEIELHRIIHIYTQMSTCITREIQSALWTEPMSISYF